MILGSRWQICLDRLKVIIYVNFQKQIVALLFKRTTIISLFSESLAYKNKNFSNKLPDLFIKYLLKLILLQLLSFVL